MNVIDLEALDRAELIDVWTDVMKCPVPKGLSKALMRRLLASEIQNRQFGGVPTSLKKALMRPEDKPARVSSDGLRQGGRLLREWNEVTYVVEMTPDGYLWRGRTHRSLSLSAIAREITGAHWSGPWFFSLNRKART